MGTLWPETRAKYFLLIGWFLGAVLKFIYKSAASRWNTFPVFDHQLGPGWYREIKSGGQRNPGQCRNNKRGFDRCEYRKRMREDGIAPAQVRLEADQWEGRETLLQTVKGSKVKGNIPLTDDLKAST